KVLCVILLGPFNSSLNSEKVGLEKVMMVKV
ncbi:MAG: hypothetical protein CG438_1592, partial [Methylococcaceae bacterium NSP1-1]